MKIDPEIRRGVIESLPEAKGIENQELRDKVYDAWSMSLSDSGFRRIEDIPASGNPDTPELKKGTQADHLRGVARLAAAITRELNDMFGDFDVDMDEVIAGGLCHDIGKPFEFDPKNQERWRQDPRTTGWPSMRHTIYGAHVALTAGLSEKIAHIASAHSKEGEFVKRSLVAEIVHYADYAFWRVLEKAGLLENQ
jgi:putative nucleotidyltransferase with HDIG domain